MASPAFSFDFSRLYSGVAPMFEALAARYPELLDVKMREARQGPEMIRRAFETSESGKRLEQKMARRGFQENVNASRAAQALANRERNRGGGGLPAEMERRYAMTSPARDVVYPGRGLAGMQFARTADRVGKMAAAGIPVGTYDPIDRMAEAGARGGAPEAASANIRTAATAGCPPGYRPSAFGGCQPTGTTWE